MEARAVLVVETRPQNLGVIFLRYTVSMIYSIKRDEIYIYIHIYLDVFSYNVRYYHMREYHVIRYNMI